MGSYINIGVVGNEDTIIGNILNFIDLIPNFKFYSVCHPSNDKYEEWIELDNSECTLENAFRFCLENEMAYIISSFSLEDVEIYPVDISMEKSLISGVGVIIKMPDNFIIKNLDNSEKRIEKLLISAKGFNYAFCDSEAHIDDDKYSIYIEYDEKVYMRYENWKIDGYTERG